MSRTDFIDEDLIQRRHAVQEVKLGPADDVADGRKSDMLNGGAVPVQELNLTPLARKREEINGQVANRLDELERLKARQEALERERHALESLRRNQEKYETGKRELIERLEQNMVFLEREDVRLNQHLALLSETDARFRELLAMARDLDESNWPADSDGFREELHKALATVETARKEFNTALARIEALREESRPPMPPGGGILTESLAEHSGGSRSFGEWVLVGLAVSLPLIITAVALATVFWVKSVY